MGLPSRTVLADCRSYQCDFQRRNSRDQLESHCVQSERSKRDRDHHHHVRLHYWLTGSIRALPQRQTDDSRQVRGDVFCKWDRTNGDRTDRGLLHTFAYLESNLWSFELVFLREIITIFFVEFLKSS